MKPPTAESRLLHDVRLALGREEGLALWRNSTGAVKTDGRWQQFGLAVGSSDLIGILKMRPCGCGKFISIELKSATGRLTQDQELWGRLVASLGGFFVVVRSVDEAKRAIDLARRSPCC